jgi:hypothetical protein
MRVGYEDRYAQRAQALDLCRRKIRPHDSKIGLECDDALEVEARGRSYARHPCRLRRPIRRTENADDALPRAGGKKELGGMWREAHDASGR